jgi:Kef-type K+ transport system membrane component KefB
LFGFLIALALGLQLVAAVYVAIALTFSSTIIIVKLLSDKREIDSLHGRIAVGFLIVQDIFVIVAMIVLTAAGERTDNGVFFDVLRLAGISALFVGATVVMMRWVIPPLLDRLARSQELLVLFAIAWAVALAALGDAVGFSKEVGAFLGGVSIASTPYRDAIAARLVSLRDFLLLFFFIDLGSRVDLTVIGGQLVPAAVLSLFVLIGNPLIVIAIMGYMGYRRRTSMLAGLTVAQISEFSLILAALGVALGHIGEDTLGLITLVGLVTIGVSTYAILYSGRLYAVLRDRLRFFEREVPYREIGAEQSTGPSRVDVIVIGLGRYGGDLAYGLGRRGLVVLGVDFDPQALREGYGRGLATQYGDAEDPEFTMSLPLSSASWVVSTLPSLDVNAAIAHGLSVAGYTGDFAATAHRLQDADRLHQLGASRVLLPFSDAADQAIDLILEEIEGDAALA